MPPTPFERTSGPGGTAGSLPFVPVFRYPEHPWPGAWPVPAGAATAPARDGWDRAYSAAVHPVGGETVGIIQAFIPDPGAYTPPDPLTPQEITGRMGFGFVTGMAIGLLLLALRAR